MIVFLSLSSGSACCHTDVIGGMQEGKLVSRFQDAQESMYKLETYMKREQFVMHKKIS